VIAKIKTVSIALVLSLFIFSACTAKSPQTISTTATPDTKIANPASVYCGQNGGKLEMRPDALGANSGVCVFPDKTACDEWAFYRGECAPGTRVPADETQNKAVEIVRNQLASQLKVEASTLELVSVESSDWSDACLGLPQAGETCSQVITPGFRVTFSSAGQNFAFHTDLSASMVRQETS
jgi:putative hemolysin